MKLSTYIEALQLLHKQHGDTLPLYYSHDDEGNHFQSVHFVPVVIRVLVDKQVDDEEEQGKPVICIN